MRSSGLALYVCIGLVVFGFVDRLERTLNAATDPAAVFSKKCSSCHTYGGGDRVGPDLKGVTSRRTRAWLMAWIRSPQRMVDSGDPIAKALVEKFRNERMPDQDYSPAEIAAIVDYLAAGGPASGEPSRPPHAITATAADVAFGRALFFGTATPQSGDAPCAACHVVRQPGEAPISATLGGDLTHVYSKFQDAALSTFLRRPCVPRAVAPDGAAVLTPREAFAIKAFLRHADRGGARERLR